VNAPIESPIPDTLERVRARVAERFPADLERIRGYLRQPSVSAAGEGIRAAAEATGAWIEGAGGAFELVETPGHPLVLGELPGPPGAPRLLRNGMYDVQPAGEPGWTSPPFAAEVRDLPGVGPAVVARGSANSKGCLAALFLAAEALRELGAAAVRRHLDGHGFGHVEVRLPESYPWAKAPPGNRAEQALVASYRALGRRPLPYPLAPWCAPYFVFDRILGLPWAAGGVGHAAGAHGPDEYATLAGLQEHVVGAAGFLPAYAAGELGAPA
jgi:acetylornithine deacetylase/succinyl-diaminopimelate desuccinylase-like protein